MNINLTLVLADGIQIPVLRQALSVTCNCKMTKYIKIVLLAFLLACNNKQSQTFNIPSGQELNQIIEAVIYQDSLPVFKTNLYRDTIIDSNGNKKIRHSTSYPLLIDLRKLKTTIPDSTKKTLTPPIYDAISVFKLLSELGLGKYKPNGKFIVPESDYNYLLFQNTILNHFAIKNNFPDSLLITTFAEQQKKRKQGILLRYYDLTVPILSASGKKACVLVTFQCSGTYGDLTAIYLEKKDKKWQIVNRKRLWTS